MDGIERWAGLSDHDLILITVTKLEGLDKKVGSALDQMKNQSETQATECKAEDAKVDGLDTRLTRIETYFAVAAVAIPTVSGLVVWITDRLWR